MIKKFAANDIANEMFRLLKKTAQDVAPQNDHTDNMESEETREADDAEDNLEDFLMKEDEDEVEDETASYVDGEIESMEHWASDELMRETEGSAEMTASAKDQHLMTGLGKIEASLRRKGEGFAADLVRTTAMSIKQDIVKAASQKTYVLKNLIKMASDLDSRGQKKAAGLVKMTIEKINR